MSPQTEEKSVAVSADGAALRCKQKSSWLTGAQKKLAHAVAFNVMHLVETAGIERCAFLTITFDPKKGGILPFKEASRRFNNYARRVLGELFPERIKVLEFQRNGNPHYHLLVVCEGDVRTGFNFDHFEEMGLWNRIPKAFRVALERPRGSLCANPLLRGLWKRLRESAGNYGIGRIELAPIRTGKEAVGRYIGGYMSKGLPARSDEHKGARFVSYSKDFERLYKGPFAWVDKGREWRQKLAKFAATFGASDLPELTMLFGPKWAFTFRDSIASQSIDPLASGPEAARASHNLLAVGVGPDETGTEGNQENRDLEVLPPFETSSKCIPGREQVNRSEPRKYTLLSRSASELWHGDKAQTEFIERMLDINCSTKVHTFKKVEAQGKLKL